MGQDSSWVEWTCNITKILNHCKYFIITNYHTNNKQPQWRSTIRMSVVVCCCRVEWCRLIDTTRAVLLLCCCSVQWVLLLGAVASTAGAGVVVVQSLPALCPPSLWLPIIVVTLLYLSRVFLASALHCYYAQEMHLHIKHLCNLTFTNLIWKLK